jgi:PadR family transcriptional regulator PadR
MNTKDDALKITTQMRKGILEYVILSVIERGEAYASDILETLTKNKLLIVEWTLYPLLTRLKDDRLIAYYWVESESWPPRKYYKLTPYWKETHLLMKNLWKELSEAVTKITQ